MFWRFSAVPVLLLALTFPLHVQAAPIDFESIPGVGTPTEGLVISDQFLVAEGITFALEGGGNPRIAQVGPPTTAFQGPGAGDTPAPGQGIGSFFLTDDGILTGLSSPALIVSYLTPTMAASGVILDIDFDESFTIQARDSADNILAILTIDAGDSGTGDGIATPWSLSRGSADIASIRFAGTRTTPGAFGLGFDNFDARSAAPVPEPATLWLLGTGCLGGLLCWRKRRA